MPSFRLTSPARSDIVAILLWSQDSFGLDARLRYRALIEAAIDDIAADPDRMGARPRPELGADVHSWHLRLSREHSAAERVHQPRHFLVYRVDGSTVVIGRVLHESMDPLLHLDPDSTWG